MAKINELDRQIMNVLAPPYRAPSKRGGAGGKRQLLISEMLRPPSNAPGSREQRLPCIRISGAWLQARGFQIGGRVEITEEQGRLVLTVVSDEDVPCAGREAKATQRR
jgi:hypothetical protein